MKILGLLLLVSFNALAGDWSREDILDYVNLSPLYVDQHNKAGWVGLFADDGFVQDPVGGATFHKSEKNEIGRFYDAFIAKNKIHFNIKNDIVSDLSVIRDAVVEAYLPEVDATVLTPAHLRYNLEEVGNELRVKSLQAYWSMPQVTKETLARGKVGRKIMKVQFRNIMKGLGTGLGLEHFLKASIEGVQGRGKKVVQKMLDDYTQNNLNAFLKNFSKDAHVVFNADHVLMAPSEYFAMNKAYSVYNVNKVISSGNSVAWNAEIGDGLHAPRPAMMVAHFKNLKIELLEIFTNAEHESR